MNRFIEQARADYIGTPTRIARFVDKYGEEHVLIESCLPCGKCLYLDWIGAEYATEPDEWDEKPPYAPSGGRKSEGLAPKPRSK